MLDTKTLRNSADAHLIGAPPPRRAVATHLLDAAQEIDDLRARVRALENEIEGLHEDAAGASI